MDKSKLLKLDLQHFAQKYYKTTTGVDEFYYAVLDEMSVSIIKGTPEFVDFLQTLNIEMPQEVARAYGSNKTAEIAVGGGDVTVTSAFHRIPEEDKKVLFGLEESEDGIMAYGTEDTPPYVAVVFAKTFEDGSKEWVGLTKGVFLRPNDENSSKQGSAPEFTGEESTAEFMDREVAGYEKPKTKLTVREKAGSTTKRDALFQKIFGTGYPTTTTTTSTTTA